MNAKDEGMYVFEQHPRIFCVILGVSGKQSGVSGNQSGNGESGPFWIRFPGVCCSHQLQSANAAWGGGLGMAANGLRDSVTAYRRWPSVLPDA